MRVLVIEDEPKVANAMREGLEAEGYQVVTAPDGEDGFFRLSTEQFDVVLVDLGLPGRSGLEVLKAARARGIGTPVIAVTARDALQDRVEGLDCGADDYLVKPFDLSELTARLAAVARRYGGNPNPLLRIGNLDIDLARRFVSSAGRPVDLTAREWAVLERLLRRPNAIIGKSEIEESLYEFGAEIESNAVEVYVSRLRKKLGHDAIKTIRGVGYKVEA
jgi:two-component system, OmpR family, response regulator